MSNQQSQNKTPLSPEEQIKLRKDLKAYYNEQISLLKPQKEYEVLLADVEEARLRRMSCIMKMAQISLSSKEREPTKESEPGKRSAGMHKVNQENQTE